MNEFFQICAFLDQSLQIQVIRNVETLELATGRPVREPERLRAQLRRAARFTYLGWGLVHEKFTASLQAMSPRAAARVANLVERAPGLQAIAA